MARQSYTVAVYDCDRAYGGPEEGGWWFNCGTLIKPVRTFPSEDQAFEFARRMNAKLRHFINSHRRPMSSVLSEGEIWAEVHEGAPPKHYPEYHPHYE